MEHDLDTYDNIEEESNEDDGEDMAELEAMLYSQIHYQPEDLDKSDFIVNSSAMGVTELPERLGFETPGGDSGCGLSHVSSDVEEEEENVSKYSISTSKEVIMSMLHVQSRTSHMSKVGRPTLAK